MATFSPRIRKVGHRETSLIPSVDDGGIQRRVTRRLLSGKVQTSAERRLGLCHWSISDEPSPGKWNAKDLEDSRRRGLRWFIWAVGCNGGRFIQCVSGIDKPYQSLRRVIVVTDLSHLPDEAVSRVPADFGALADLFPMRISVSSSPRWIL